VCDIQTAMAGVGRDVQDIRGRKMDLDKQCVQIAAIAGLTALGITAIVIDGDVGNMIAVAIAGAIGYLARSLFPRGETDETEV